MSESLKTKTVKGVMWSAVQRFSVQGIQAIVMLIIANRLGPRAFGLIGMLAIFMDVSQSLIDSGFSQALIRKQDRTDTDKCTVFYFNIAVSVILYLAFFVAAPWVSDFYNEPQLTALMRALCVVIILNSFALIQRTIYVAAIDFKTLAKISLTAALVSGGVGVYMAFAGFGVWTLVWQQIVRAVVSTLLLWWYSTWRPQLIYSWQSFRQLFSFGSKLMVSGLIDTVYGNIYQITIGKLYSAVSLGHYSQAKTICSLPSSNINGIISSVTYPVLSSMQKDDERLAVNYRKLLRVSAFIVFPLMCGLAGVAYPLVLIILGEQWRFAATLLIPLSFMSMWYPVHAINLNLLKVKGRSDLFLRLEIIKKILGVSMLLITSSFGVLVMCYGSIANSIIALLINTYYTGKLIHVGFARQMRDLSGVLVTSLLMFVLVFLSTRLFDSNILQLIVGIIVGAVFFIIVCLVFRFKEIEYLKSLLKK